MDAQFRDRFITLWRKYFGEAELPIGFYYTNHEACRGRLRPTVGHACLIGQLGLVRKGRTLCVSGDTVGCFGGKRYLGFRKEVIPDFEYFLSCGIPGKVIGERYKKSPQIVRQAMANQASFDAPAQYAVFKRWDKLEESDPVEVVIFFAIPDVLSGLFTLANFDETDPLCRYCPVRGRLRRDHALPLSRKGPQPAALGDRNVRHLRPSLRPGLHDLFRDADGEIRADGREHGRKLPHHRLLGEGETQDTERPSPLKDAD